MLPEERRSWLKETLKQRGFSGYERIADELNEQLEADGYAVTIGKSAIHAFGQEYRAFVKYQEEAGAWAAEWMSDQGLEDEANRHSVLFQMLTTLAFKSMKGQMEEDKDIDVKDLHFLGKMMKDIMASSGMREKMMEAERSVQAEKLDKAVEAGVIDKMAAQKAREIMGFG